MSETIAKCLEAVHHASIMSRSDRHDEFVRHLLKSVLSPVESFQKIIASKFTSVEHAGDFFLEALTSFVDRGGPNDQSKSLSSGIYEGSAFDVALDLLERAFELTLHSSYAYQVGTSTDGSSRTVIFRNQVDKLNLAYTSLAPCDVSRDTNGTAPDMSISWHEFAHSVLLTLALDREKLMISYIGEVSFPMRLQSLSPSPSTKIEDIDLSAWATKVAGFSFSPVTLRDPEEGSDAISISAMIDVEEETTLFEIEEDKGSVLSEGLCTSTSHSFMALREARLEQLAKGQFRDIKEFKRVQFAPFTRYIDTDTKFDVAIQELNELRKLDSVSDSRNGGLSWRRKRRREMAAAGLALNPLSSSNAESYPVLTEMGVYASTHQFSSYNGYCTKVVLATDDCDYIFECSPASLATRGESSSSNCNVRHRMHELQPLFEDPVVLKVIENGLDGTARSLLRDFGLVLVNTLEILHVARLMIGGDISIQHTVSACASSGVRGSGKKVKNGKSVSSDRTCTGSGGPCEGPLSVSALLASANSKSKVPSRWGLEASPDSDTSSLSSGSAATTCYNKFHLGTPSLGGLGPYAGEFYLHADCRHHATKDAANTSALPARDLACEELLALQSRARALLLLCHHLRIAVWQEHGDAAWLFVLECSRSDVIRLLKSIHHNSGANTTPAATPAATSAGDAGDAGDGAADEDNEINKGFWSAEYRRLITPTRPMVIPHPNTISRAQDQRMKSLWTWRDAKARQLDIAPVNVMACAEVVRLATRNPRNTTELITRCSPLSATVLAYHREILGLLSTAKGNKHGRNENARAPEAIIGSVLCREELEAVEQGLMPLLTLLNQSRGSGEQQSPAPEEGASSGQQHGRDCEEEEEEEELSLVMPENKEVVYGRALRTPVSPSLSGQGASYHSLRSPSPGALSGVATAPRSISSGNSDAGGGSALPPHPGSDSSQHHSGLPPAPDTIGRFDQTRYLHETAPLSFPPGMDTSFGASQGRHEEGGNKSASPVMKVHEVFSLAGWASPTPFNNSASPLTTRDASPLNFQAKGSINTPQRTPKALGGRDNLDVTSHGDKPVLHDTCPPGASTGLMDPPTRTVSPPLSDKVQSIRRPVEEAGKGDAHVPDQGSTHSSLSIEEGQLTSLPENFEQIYQLSNLNRQRKLKKRDDGEADEDKVKVDAGGSRGGDPAGGSAWRDKKDEKPGATLSAFQSSGAEAMAVRSSLDGGLPSTKVASTSTATTSGQKTGDASHASLSHGKGASKSKAKGSRESEQSQLSRLLFDESFYYDALSMDAGKGVEKANYHGKKIYPGQAGATNAEVLEILEFVREISWVRDETELESVRLGHLEDLRLHVDNDHTGTGTTTRDGGSNPLSARSDGGHGHSGSDPRNNLRGGSNHGNNSRHGGGGRHRSSSSGSAH